MAVEHTDLRNEQKAKKMSLTFYSGPSRSYSYEHTPPFVESWLWELKRSHSNWLVFKGYEKSAYSEEDSLKDWYYFHGTLSDHLRITVHSAAEAGYPDHVRSVGRVLRGTRNQKSAAAQYHSRRYKHVECLSATMILIPYHYISEQQND